MNLLSNECKDEFPSNNASNFVNRFKQEITVHPLSEIALSELKIHQQLSLEGMKDAEFSIFDFEKVAGQNIHGQTKWGGWKTYQLDVDCYKDANELCGCLNLMIYKYILRLRQAKPKIFYYDSSMNRIWCNVKEEYNILILLKKSLLVLLGAESVARESPLDYIVLGRTKRAKNYLTKEGKLRFFDAENCNQDYFVDETTKGLNYFALPPFLKNVNEILVHVSVIEPQMIANERNQRVIRFVPINSKFNGRSVVYSFSGNRCYMNLDVCNFTEIGIKLTDLKNIPLPLIGDTRLQLHVRRKTE